MDLLVFNFIHGFAGRLGFLDTAGIFLAKYLPFLMFFAVLVFILRQKPWQKKVFVTIVAGLTLVLSRGLITEVIRFFYDRPRPFRALGFEPLLMENSHSFPSGHAATLFALAFVMFGFNKRLGYWFLVLATLNGLARIFVGVHWPTDISGAIIVALISYLVAKEMLKNYEPKVLDKSPDIKTP